MGGDIWVDYYGKDAPSCEELRQLLEDFLGGGAVSIEWKKDRFFVTLHGEMSYAHRRVGPSTEALRATWKERESEHEARSFEVWRSRTGDCVNIITRMPDRFTLAVAVGLAELCAQGWKGTVAPP